MSIKYWFHSFARRDIRWLQPEDSLQAANIKGKSSCSHSRQLDGFPKSRSRSQTDCSHHMQGVRRAGSAGRNLSITVVFLASCLSLLKRLWLQIEQREMKKDQQKVWSDKGSFCFTRLWRFISFFHAFSCRQLASFGFLEISSFFSSLSFVHLLFTLVAAFMLFKLCDSTSYLSLSLCPSFSHVAVCARAHARAQAHAHRRFTHTYSTGQSFSDYIKNIMKWLKSL